MLSQGLHTLHHLQIFNMMKLSDHRTPEHLRMENEIIRTQLEAKDFQLKLLLAEANLLLISISPEGIIEYCEGRILQDQNLDMLDFLGHELKELGIVPFTKAYKLALQGQEFNSQDHIWNNQLFEIKSKIERDEEDQSIRRIYLLVAPK